jgi:hypothetical protein
MHALKGGHAMSSDDPGDVTSRHVNREKAMFARATAALTLVLLLGTGLAPSIAFLCRMTGEVSTRCCCDDGNAAEQAELRAEMDCCDVLRANGDLPPATAREKIPPPVPLVAVAPAVPELLGLSPSSMEVRADAREPPNRKWPLFTFHCSLLI